VKILLDTHTLLWFVLGDAKLSGTARAHIEDLQNDKLVSPASYWEIAIKISIGKYTLPQRYEDFMQKSIAGNGFSVLPIEPKHTAALLRLPFHHRDPFDRLIIAQSMVEQIAIIGGDPDFDAYPVTRIW
jgi:PIN domain nuclease of toxin-antitoxin system